jgi:ABC-2 type transport system ATP-binding protein
MQRRLDLAAALINRPRILFLDEPTTGLDPVSREAIWRYVGQLNERDGVTIFLTTQYLEEADRLAHDVAIIDTGRIVAQGSPGALKASIGTDVITLTIEGGGDLTARAAKLFEGMDGVKEVRIAGDSAVVYRPDGARAIQGMVLALAENGISATEIRLAHPTLDDVFLQKTGHHMEVGGAGAHHEAAGTAR